MEAKIFNIKIATSNDWEQCYKGQWNVDLLNVSIQDDGFSLIILNFALYIYKAYK